MDIKGTRFANMEDIKSNATAELREILKKSSADDSNNDNIDGQVCEGKKRFILLNILSSA